MGSSPPDVRLVAARVRGRVLVRPPAPADPSGAVLGFHGYLETAESQLERLERIGGLESWLLVSVQALHRVYRGRSTETVASWMTRQDRDAMIEDNIAYVDAVVDDLGLAAERRPIVCAGFSQGGAMAFRAGVRGRFAAAGIVSVGSDVPPEVLSDPDATFPPVLLVRGTRDEWLTAEKFARDVDALRARGVDVTPVVLDGGHEWTADASAAAAGFIQNIVRRARA